MDGYSVKDAAVVLGIPERRVWELLARGVLAGAPEGPDGMIVFLQPRSAGSPVAASDGGAAAGPESPGSKANGNGGSGELSPFRELLTEFRNLTERYGQALLALGEARGEVASLRTRVELLEARVDLRLPSPPSASTVTWEIPAFEQEEAFPPTAEADASRQEPPTPAYAEADEAEETVAGEDEPAAEPMIDLIEEAAVAEALVADVEPAAEPPVSGAPAVEAVPDESEPAAGAAVEQEPLEAVEQVEKEPAQSEPEPAQEATMMEPEAEIEATPEPPRRRARGGRTAMAGFAAALARAEDPTAAELPGAEETAAALAALQRDIDASRAAEGSTDSEAPHLEPEVAAEPEPQPESLAEPPLTEEVAATAAVVEAMPVAEAEPEAAMPVAETEPEAAEPEAAEPEVVIDAEALDEAEADAAVVDEGPAIKEAITEPDLPEPPQTTVPSYYSTDVVEPDWFADGDFSWLEAAQAEAIRIEAAQAEAGEPSPGPAVEIADASVQEESQDDQSKAADENPETDDAEEMSAVAIDVDEGEPAVADELAFGDHPATDATPPDLGHEGFEPSVESQAIAEEEARAAIQDAFDDGPGTDEEGSPEEAGGGVAVTTAVMEHEPSPAPSEEVEDAPEESEAADEQHEAALANETESVDTVDEQVAEEAPVVEAGAEQRVEVEAEVEIEPEAAAIQDAFEPAEAAEPPGEESVHEQHAGDVEAEAIQDAFEEPMPAPEWQAPGDVAAPPTDQPAPRSDEPTPRTDEPAPGIGDPPRASDDSPRTMAAVAGADAFRGPEEFIAPPRPVVMPPPATLPPPAQPSSAAGEEELMWLGDEFEEAGLEVAAQGWRSPDAVPARTAPAPVLELSDAELAQLAEDEGWDQDEVEAIRRLLGRPSDALPPEPEQPAAAQASAATGSEAPSTLGRPAGPPASAWDTPSTLRPPSSVTSAEPGEEEDPEWLQGRSGAAAEAYRRLRKLFPS